MVIATPRPLFPHERDKVPIAQRAECVSGTFWTGVEKKRRLAPTGVRNPDSQIRNGRYDYSIPAPENIVKLSNEDEEKSSFVD